MSNTDTVDAAVAAIDQPLAKPASIVTLIEQRGDEAGKAAHVSPNPTSHVPGASRPPKWDVTDKAVKLLTRALRSTAPRRSATSSGRPRAQASRGGSGRRDDGGEDGPARPPAAGSAGKWCPTCEQVKAVAEFGVNRRKRDGLSPRCRRCAAEGMRKWRAANPHRVRAATRAHDAAHPEQRGARAAVARAILAGVLKRPASCTLCGAEGKTDAHHESYDRDRWLDVVFVCRRCHLAVHRGELRVAS